MHRAHSFLISVTFPFLIGCAPVIYSATSAQAKSALKKAEAVNAPEKAPYQYWKAQAYLEKAKEEAGYSDFQPAIQYNRIAKENALKAVESSKAQSTRRGPDAKK